MDERGLWLLKRNESTGKEVSDSRAVILGAEAKPEVDYYVWSDEV